MHSPFLVGMLAAWALAQAATGLFFLIAPQGQRERDFWSFGGLCFALAATTAGVAIAYAARSPQEWLLPSYVAHAGAIVAAPMNMQFVIRHCAIRGAERWITMQWTAAVLFGLWLVTGSWWVEGSLATTSTQVLGFGVKHVTAQPSSVAFAFYGVAGAELVGALAFLVRRHLARRDVLAACIGAFAVALAGVNDMLLVTNAISTSLYLLPHAFMVYAFSIGVTLLGRYHRAQGELAQKSDALARANEELRHSHSQLEVVQDELSEKAQLATVGELAAAIAHEVRNPLAIIMNAVAGLRRKRITDHDRETLLGILDEETARLNRLVGDLLRFARPVSVKRSRASLLELAERTQAVAGEHRVIVSPEPGARVHVWADPNLLRIVFDNLVENACQAMLDGGDVTVRISDGRLDGEPAVTVDISDTGPGMSQSVLSRALDPFFTTRPSGTGLGLPIVQRITRAHGGTMEIDSREGEGTRIRLVLPVAQPEIAEAEAAS